MASKLIAAAPKIKRLKAEQKEMAVLLGFVGLEIRSARVDHDRARMPSGPRGIARRMSVEMAR